MPAIRRTAAAAAAVVTLFTAATACGPGDDKAAAGPGSSAAAGDKKGEAGQDTGGADLPNGLPSNLDDIKKWEKGGWKDWDRWSRKASEFANPIIKDLWNPSRMAEAKTTPDVTAQSAGTADGGTDPEPRPVQAQQVARPYHQHMAPIGKIMFDSPQGPMVCSGTVVEDPAHPGKSNLVWTAGHCVHTGKSGGWMRNIVFVPSYNDQGLPMSQVGRAPAQEVAPYGVWWANWVTTSGEWIDMGSTKSGNAGSAYDFAVLHVRPERGGGKSLQETVGAALPVWFGAPSADRINGLQAFGYPAAPPYDGARMMNCPSRPGRLTMSPGTPAMHRIGCTMTGGTSGGGWFTNRGGRTYLVSNSSIGSLDHTWLAGPHLGVEAKRVFEGISRKFA
ncbi:hypothetical protein ADK70_25220 [Streptomyces rimosus subsp. pseudoverticillatus]|uniref:trypsin-like serine peptidase n=1 Tax=Streptomyces rimosus TaxID=1927 RepID=UPI0006C17BFB|nr:hypothetical protein [Streptomyces rimosus]KOT82129.1 hypothetical protein ADK70_25220 [Streptomyces rimosus subsp. pseudoverticillatus]